MRILNSLHRHGLMKGYSAGVVVPIGVRVLGPEEVQRSVAQQLRMSPMMKRETMTTCWGTSKAKVYLLGHDRAASRRPTLIFRNCGNCPMRRVPILPMYKHRVPTLVWMEKGCTCGRGIEIAEPACRMPCQWTGSALWIEKNHCNRLRRSSTRKWKRLSLSTDIGIDVSTVRFEYCLAHPYCSYILNMYPSRRSIIPNECFEEIATHAYIVPRRIDASRRALGWAIFQFASRPQIEV